jgi:colanic acid/amylovoran biosynthesis glycosyltransferase
VVSFRGYDLNFSGVEEHGFYDEVWEEADAFHFLGEDLWRRSRARGCPGDVKKALIPPAVDLDFWRPSKRDRDKRPISTVRPLRVVSVGRFEWKKGYEFAMRAVRLLNDAGLPTEYRVIGDGGFFEAVAFARAQESLADVVQLEGALSRNEVRDALYGADAFLHSAVSEGFCNAVIEAQACGLPVVCTDAGGLPENVVDNETGFVVPRRDATALAAKLELLAHDAGLRRRMGEAGQERVARFFTLDRQMSAFESLYREVIG